MALLILPGQNGLEGEIEYDGGLYCLRGGYGLGGLAEEFEADCSGENVGEVEGGENVVRGSQFKQRMNTEKRGQ